MTVKVIMILCSDCCIIVTHVYYIYDTTALRLMTYLIKQLNKYMFSTDVVEITTQSDKYII